DLAVWPLTGPSYAGAVADPIEAWLRCGPTTARHTVVNGELVVRDGHLVHPALDDRLTDHRRIATRIQGLDLR
ncbi:MAG: 8-oxoguanine deaminase, partial [Acidimicrobiia bacterium]|nr:8-oxoguanine deaminase [Acidimicrobiia bacterium]